MLTDKELVKEIKSGSQSAMEVLVNRHYKMTYSFIYRKVADKHISYDLTQEVFVKMLKNINSYSEKGEFKNWLLTIASNHCMDFFRSREYKQFSIMEDIEEKIHRIENDVTYIFNKNEKRQIIKEALRRLPEYQSEAIILKYFHDLKIKEIAKVTKTTDSTVKSRLKQGTAKLKELLRKDDFYEENRR